MLHTMFYSMGFIFLIYELLVLFNPSSYNKFVSEFGDMVKSKGDPRYFTHGIFISFLMIPYVLWTFLGLFSFQWEVFTCLLMLSGFTHYADKYYGFKYNNIITIVDSLISIMLVLSILDGYFNFKF